jgi:hypothetical protein
VFFETQVCGPFFQKVVGVSKTKMGDARERVEQGRLRSVSQSNVGKRSNSTRGSDLTVWMNGYFALHGQYIPNMFEMHLPIEMCKQDVHNAYTRSILFDQIQFESGVDLRKPIKLTQFYRLWESEFPLVKCTKWSPFTRCTDCTDLRLQVESCPEAQKGMFNRCYG